jgi:hypothetical protein
MANGGFQIADFRLRCRGQEGCGGVGALTSALQATARLRSGFMFRTSGAPCLSASVEDMRRYRFMRDGCGLNPQCARDIANGPIHGRGSGQF